MKKSLILSIAILFSLNSFGKIFENEQKISNYFSILSRENTDFEPMGEVCERVAVLEVMTIYPIDKFEIINSIQYDEKNTTIGELDIVIINKASGMVEAVSEVKCWRSLEGALKKAKDQRQRFLTHLNRNIVLYDLDNNKYSQKIFGNIQKYFSISQLGGVEHGFDMELGLDMKELMELRNRLLNCKAEGHCR